VTTEWPSEELWRKSLKLQMTHLRNLERDGSSSPEEIERARDRVERIWLQGPAEWQAGGRPHRLP